MDLGLVLAPMGALVALGLGVAAWSGSRPGARAAVPLRWVLAAAVAAGLLLAVLGRLGIGPAEWLGRDTLARILGLALLGGAGALTFVAGRNRRRAELSVASAPQALDDAARVVRATGRPLQGVFRGRISSDEAVTSPSGVVCAFFEAELRAPADGGRKGPLLSTERGFGTTLWLKGERAIAAVAFDPAQLQAPEEVRACTLIGRLADEPVEVKAFERLGRIGESCLVVGELRPGPVAGSWEIRGAGRGPAPVVVGHDASALGRAARRRSAATFAGAVGLCAAAAWLLARYAAS